MQHKNGQFVAVTPEFHHRIWGVEPAHPSFRGWYDHPAIEPVGEAWLTPVSAPVLIKYLFPAQPLSVQVHPDDAYAARHGMGRGKTEAWYVVAAEPGASVGVGLRPGIDLAALELACRAGRAAELLQWIAVAPGDLISVPAGTVHAIGPGLVLCEVQQPSDNTFRLDDYARRDAAGNLRALHLEHGLAVVRECAMAGRVEHGLAAESGVMFTCPWFQIARRFPRDGVAAAAPIPAAGARVVVNLGPGQVNLEGVALRPGHAAMAGGGPGWTAQCTATLLDVTVPASAL